MPSTKRLTDMIDDVAGSSSFESPKAARRQGRLLAVTSLSKLAALPEVVTVVEGFVTGFQMKDSNCSASLAGTSPDIVPGAHRAH